RPHARPENLLLTRPMVTHVAQIEAMVLFLEGLEEKFGLPAGRLTFEIQIETPQAILGIDGRSPIGPMIAAGQGRITGMPYGTYDYSASVGIAAAYQSLEHPSADFAKAVMQASAAGTGVRLSDGSTNIMPVGESRDEAWQLHGRLVTRSLQRGFYQSWDLHPAQLPSRYAATFAFFRASLENANMRLAAYLGEGTAEIMDEPATARALAHFLRRGLRCGAISQDEGAVQVDQLEELIAPRATRTRRSRAADSPPSPGPPWAEAGASGRQVPRVNRLVRVHPLEVELEHLVQRRLSVHSAPFERLDRLYLPRGAVPAEFAARLDDLQVVIDDVLGDLPAGEPLRGEGQQVPQDQFVPRHGAVPGPIHRCLDAVARTGGEVLLSGREGHPRPRRAVLSGEHLHRSVVERCVGDRVGNGRPGGQHPVLHSQVWFAVDDVVDRPVPAIDRSVVQAQLL